MDFLLAMTFSGWLLEVRSGEVLQVIALALSPFIAIRLQKWWEQTRDHRRTQERIFKDLMATRATPTAQARVNALNMVDVEFYGGGEQERVVREAYNAHIETLYQLTPDDATSAVVGKARQDTYIRLLNVMANCLGYQFDPTHIKTSVYQPVAHDAYWAQDQRTRALTLELLEGKRALKVKNEP